METINQFKFEIQLLSSLIGIVSSIIIDTWIFLRIIRKKNPQTNTLVSAIPTLQVGKWRTTILIGLMITNALVLLIASYALGRKLTQPINHIQTSPQLGAVLSSYEEPVTFTFDAPINFDLLMKNSNPPVEATWYMQRYIPFLPFGRHITYVPHTSFEPNQKVMLYLSNITTPFSKSYGSEHLLEFHAPILPSVNTTAPVDAATNVEIDTDLHIFLLSPNGDHVTWDATVTPQQTLSLHYPNPKEIVIDFDAALSQNTRYTVNIFQTPRTFDTRTKAVLETGDRKLVKTIEFTTAKAPLISTFGPEGDHVSPNSHIQIKFDEPMDPESLGDKLKITPQVSGDISWNDDFTTLTYTPTILQKDTEYSVSLTHGIRSKKSGVLTLDQSYRFKTIGAVTAKSLYPVQTSPHIQSNTPIIVEFDQEVDHTSAAEHFSINPPAAGTFSWEGNTMKYQPTSPLGFATTYTYKLTPGIASVVGLPSVDEFSASFTTQSDQLILNVPLYHQQENFTCNIAAARMLLSYRGVMVSESDLKKQIGPAGSRGNGNPNLGHVENFGTFWDPIGNVIGKYKPYRIFKEWTLNQLISEVVAGNPVMVWAQNGWSHPHEISWDLSDGTHIYAINGMHSYVVKGFRGSTNNPTHILVNDPWRGNRALPTEEFMRLWNYYKVALIVDP